MVATLSAAIGVIYALLALSFGYYADAPGTAMMDAQRNVGFP